jgi:hypothetical protein
MWKYIKCLFRNFVLSLRSLFYNNYVTVGQLDRIKYSAWTQTFWFFYFLVTFLAVRRSFLAAEAPVQCEGCPCAICGAVSHRGTLFLEISSVSSHDTPTSTIATSSPEYFCGPISWYHSTCSVFTWGSSLTLPLAHLRTKGMLLNVTQCSFLYIFRRFG